MSKRVRIGDVVEIGTAKGFSYAQLSHKHAQYGYLLRILPRFFETRPDDFAEVVNQSELFVTFLPLQSAVNGSIFEVVANCPVPEFAKAFPIFRAGIRDPAKPKIEVWWFWDGEKEWRVGDISPEQRKMPVRGIWNDTLLVERIESGWTPSNDPS